ncbi:MAG TPA: CBS domain-containing protein, partial [Geobacterales bacterium]|nr:CBS domain-containing protein [Geobacterales bacterium]
AMVAARRLYPNARMVFSGSQEKSMRDFFLKSTGYALDFTRLRDLDLDAVTRLIIVDCQNRSRIGPFAAILDRPNLSIHIYDHHPASYGDITAHGGVIRDCGASTTILSGLLRQQGVTVTPTEATLMMLGIYEDTGSLTFHSTTVDDYLAAAWLLEQGGDLNTVADFLTQELTAEQVSLLNDLLKSLQTLTVNGVEIALAHASVDYYIGDIAALAHMMRDMENLDALVMAVEMGSRTYLVARSRLPEVDVGELLRKFGGGGHATAASATVKDLTIIQVVEQLKQQLASQVNRQRLARDLMTSPVKSMPATTTIMEARELLSRYNVNAMPVLELGKMVGIISRRIVERAVIHGLGHVPVSDYMYSEFLAATPETPIDEIQSYMVGHNRRFVPVFNGSELVGAVTRTDLLRTMALPRPADADLLDIGIGLPVRKRRIGHLFVKQLSSQVATLLRQLGEVGDDLDLPVYAVGGFVRDLLLGVENLDIDITVEGDGILLAETFAQRYGCRVRSHVAFGTAVLIFPDGFKIDVASTRLEYYESPGALPIVERSSLRLDLYRRDFTINTLAIRLNGDEYGVLIDYFAGQRDLQERMIRVLHNLSFVEDPTRVFRAIRFEQRLGFTISAHTENLIRTAVRMEFLQKLGGKRLLTELIIILREREPLRAVERLDSLHLLLFIHPNLILTTESRRLLTESRDIISWYELLFLEQRWEKWQVYFLALSQPLTHDEFEQACRRLALPGRLHRLLVGSRGEGYQILSNMEHRLAQGKELSPRELYAQLHPLPTEILLHLMACSTVEAVRRHISLFISQLRPLRLQVNGDDLRALGVPEGRRIRYLLDRLFMAKLETPTLSRNDELLLAQQYLAEL